MALHTSGSECQERCEEMPKFPKPDWKNINFVVEYQNNLYNKLQEYTAEKHYKNISNEGEAQKYVDKVCAWMADCVHEACENACEENLESRKKRRHWWSLTVQQQGIEIKCGTRYGMTVDDRKLVLSLNVTKIQRNIFAEYVGLHSQRNKTDSMRLLMPYGKVKGLANFGM